MSTSVSIPKSSRPKAGSPRTGAASTASRRTPIRAVKPDTQQIPEVLSGYRVTRELGRGGMSVVYLARHKVMDREVALKVIDPAQGLDKLVRHRFIREGRLGGCITHTNVIQHLDVREDNGWYYLALEYVSGGNLREMLRKRKDHLPERLALGLVRDIACGLEAVARAGVVHRDIKPSNIFMTADMVPKIADFGVAIAAAAGLQRKDVERKRGIVIGSPRYMPPEQADPDTHLDARADIHALGATLWELLFGHPPYAGSSVKETLDQLVCGPVPDPLAQRRGISRRTANVLEVCLAKHAGDRYPTPRDLVTAIDKSLHGSPTQQLSPVSDGTESPDSAQQLSPDLPPNQVAKPIIHNTQSHIAAPPPPPTAGLPFTWTQF